MSDSYAMERAWAKCSEAEALLNRAADTRESQWILHAIGCYGEAMELAPDLVEPYVALGELWLYYEQPEQAALFLRKALELETGNEAAMRLWAIAQSLLETVET